MEKRAFKLFMDNDIVQKIIILADVLNLNIDKWTPANTTEHPYRILFYSGEDFVGFIDAITYKIGKSEYFENDMPFVLYTPLGMAKGGLFNSFELFKFDIENRKDFTSIDGLLEVKKDNKKGYFISTSTTLTDLENNRVEISFNRMSSSYEIEITKEDKNSDEKVMLYFSESDLIIEHSNYTRNQSQVLTKIRISLGSKSNAFPTDFVFLNQEPYQKMVGGQNKLSRSIPYWKKLELIDFNELATEIKTNDPSMFSFIHEIRRAFTLLANGITPVSVYDKLAQLCFYDESDKFKFSFSRANQTKVALKRNRILKKMIGSNQNKQQ